MAEFSPPLISGYVKLTRFSQIKIDKAYEDGFVSLRTAEPSLGTPVGQTTRTEVGSAYYFPIFGIGRNYLASRKFTGNDTLMMRNNNIGFNNPFPTFNFDISGSLRAIEGQIGTLSANALRPSPGATTLSISYPSGVSIDGNVSVAGNLTVGSITAENVFITTLLTAQNFVRDTEVVYVLTLTGASVETDISITGNLTATNVFASSAIFTPVVNASAINARDFVTVTMTVASSLSVANDIYVNNIFGKIAIDPTSALIYNNNNQLTYSGSLNYEFFVHPTDKFSTDNLDTVRSPDGAWDNTVMSNAGIDGNTRFKPFFKSIQGALDYIRRSGIFGNIITIRVFGDVVNNERRPNGGTTPTDESGTYSSLRTVAGNLTSAFFSTEWLGANYPHLTAGGVKGGDFIWSTDGNALFGETTGIEFYNLNFNELRIEGNQNIGSYRNRNTPKNIDIALFAGSGVTQTPFYNSGGEALDYYHERKVFDMPPVNITQRIYVWGGNPLSGWNARFETFNTPASNWTDLKTNNFITHTPVFYKANPTLFTQFRDICFEMESNTYKSRGFFVEQGFIRSVCSTWAILGTSMYQDGAISLNSGQVKFLADINYPTVDPFFLARWDQTSAAAVRALGVVRPDGELFDSINIFPQYGLAIVGNQTFDRQGFAAGEDPNNKKVPTLVWNETNPATGLFTIRDSAETRLWDHNPNGTYGFRGQHPTSVILDGSFNAPSLYFMYNSAMLYTSPYVFRTSTFALSTKNINFNNTGQDPTFRRTFFDSNDVNEKYNFQFLRFGGGFSYYLYNDWGLRNWVFGQTPNTIDYEYTPFVCLNNGANNPDFVFLSNGFADLFGSLFGLGAFNMIDGGRNITGRRFMRVTSPQGLRRIDTLGYGLMEDPLGGDFQPFEMDWYAPSLR